MIFRTRPYRTFSRTQRPSSCAKRVSAASAPRGQRSRESGTTLPSNWRWTELFRLCGRGSPSARPSGPVWGFTWARRLGSRTGKLVACLTAGRVDGVRLARNPNAEDPVVSVPAGGRVSSCVGHGACCSWSAHILSDQSARFLSDQSIICDGQQNYGSPQLRILLPLAAHTTLWEPIATTILAGMDDVRCLCRPQRRGRRRRRASRPRHARPGAIRDRVNLLFPRVEGGFHLSRLIVPHLLEIEADARICWRVTIVPYFFDRLQAICCHKRIKSRTFTRTDKITYLPCQT